MGAYIYRDDKWDEMQYGVISRQDIIRLNRERIREIIYAESDMDPLHRFYLELAEKYDIR